MSANSQINGVTKITRGNTVIYFFPLARVSADDTNSLLTFNYLNGYIPFSETIAFSDVSDTLGATTPTGYCDILAETGVFFYPDDDSNIIAAETATTAQFFLLNQEVTELKNIIKEMLFFIKSIAE